jgi:membrane associated rhomboid family serine protease
MSNNSKDGYSKLASEYRLKLSTVAFVVFLVFAVVVFILRNTGVLGEIEYFVALFGLIIVALVVTFVLGRKAKKRYNSTAN